MNFLEKNIIFMDYNKIDNYVDRCIKAIEKDLSDFGNLEFRYGMTLKEFIDECNMLCKDWYDEYWFFKYGGMISYVTRYIGSLDHENNSDFFDVVSLTNYAFKNQSYLYETLPFTIPTIEVSGKFYNTYCMDEDDHIFNYKASLDAYKRYIMHDIPRIERQCRFEYKLSEDKSCFNRLFMTLFIIHYLGDEINTDDIDVIGYSDEIERYVLKLQMYLMMKRADLVEELNI